MAISASRTTSIRSEGAKATAQNIAQDRVERETRASHVRRARSHILCAADSAVRGQKGKGERWAGREMSGCLHRFAAVIRTDVESRKRTVFGARQKASVAT